MNQNLFFIALSPNVFIELQVLRSALFRLVPFYPGLAPRATDISPLLGRGALNFRGFIHY